MKPEKHAFLLISRRVVTVLDAEQQQSSLAIPRIINVVLRFTILPSSPSPNSQHSQRSRTSTNSCEFPPPPTQSDFSPFVIKLHVRKLRPSTHTTILHSCKKCRVPDTHTHTHTHNQQAKRQKTIVNACVMYKRNQSCHPTNNKALALVL